MNYKKIAQETLDIEAQTLLMASKKMNDTFEKAVEIIPTLGMLIEAAAQSSSGIVNDNTNSRVGFMVSLKNIKLLQEPQDTTFVVDVKVDYKIQDLKYISFSIIKNDIKIAEGSFV